MVVAQLRGGPGSYEEDDNLDPGYATVPPSWVRALDDIEAELLSAGVVEMDPQHELAPQSPYTAWLDSDTADDIRAGFESLDLP